MTSRDGRKFQRWGEAFLRPGLQHRANWTYGDSYIAWQVIETPSSIPGAADELSLYATEGYWTGESSQLRRYSLRVDGFVSLQASLAGGEFATKPLIFEGERLEMNFSTSAAGSIRVEIQDGKGIPLEEFGLAKSVQMFGDQLDRIVEWQGGSDLSRFCGHPIRLRFVLKDADLYSIRFVPKP